MSEIFKPRTVERQQIGGGYAKGPVIIVDTAEIEPGLYETMALDKKGMDLACKRCTDEDTARKQFMEVLMQFAGPMQKAIIGAGMVPGKKYTLLRMSEFGFPMAQKITFVSAECATYAQHYDVVKLRCFVGRRRTEETIYLFYSSVSVFEGWQDLPDEAMWTPESDSGAVVTRRSKYASFDSRYLDDAKKYLTGFMGEYKDYKTGADGRVYA